MHHDLKVDFFNIMFMFYLINKKNKMFYLKNIKYIEHIEVIKNI
jgi:hypothetical protein